MTNTFNRLSLVNIICIALLFNACKKEEVEENVISEECGNNYENRNGRIIGYDILDSPENGDFGTNYTIASDQLKSEFVQLLQPWNTFENKTQGVYDGEAMQLFENLNNFALTSGISLSLIITPIDIPGRFLPAYLGQRKFDDPQVISSFNNLIDRLFNPTDGIVDPEKVIALSVGNEIDHYNWSANNDQLQEYKTFLQGIKPKVNAYGIPLHFTATLYGLEANPNRWWDIIDVVDKVSVTYYPINSDFSVKQANIASTDVFSFLSKYPTTKVFFQEVGYPSSTKLNSSEAKQALFFCHFFKAWDRHKDKISHVSILRLNDVSLASAQATAVAYGLAGNENFIEYIRTLGIRTWDDEGVDKQSFHLIEQELIKRNW
jgi:hypothetical protein